MGDLQKETSWQKWNSVSQKGQKNQGKIVATFCQTDSAEAGRANVWETLTDNFNDCLIN